MQFLETVQVTEFQNKIPLKLMLVTERTKPLIDLKIYRHAFALHFQHFSEKILFIEPVWKTDTQTKIISIIHNSKKQVENLKKNSMMFLSMND